MIVDYIDFYRSRFGVEPICRVLTEHDVPIAPSTYYAHKACPVSAAAVNDAYAANLVLDVYWANRGLYGAEKLWHALRRSGHQIGRDQVARLMRILGVAGIRRDRRIATTVRDCAADRHPDLLERQWQTVTRPDQWWVADFTYVWTSAGFVFVSFCTDVFSRRILGWRVSTSKAAPLVASVLEQALFTRRRQDVTFTATGLVHHSDAGGQGEFNWSSQHLGHGGVDGQARRMDDRIDGAIGDEVAWSSVASAGSGARVLA